MVVRVQVPPAPLYLTMQRRGSMSFNFLQRRVFQSNRQSEWFWQQKRKKLLLEKEQENLEKNKIEKSDKPIEDKTLK